MSRASSPPVDAECYDQIQGSVAFTSDGALSAGLSPLVGPSSLRRAARPQAQVNLPIRS
jgi:hypothetical protein